LRTLVVDGTGHLDVLSTASDIWRYVEGSGWTEIDAAGNVQTIAVDGTGSLYVLNNYDNFHTRRDLSRYIEGVGWTVIEGNHDVESIAAAVDGSITVWKIDGSVWRYTVTGWTLLYEPAPGGPSGPQ